MTDPIADMLTRLRNAIMAKHDSVILPASKIKMAIAQILKEEGFIQNYEVVSDPPRKALRISLKYTGRKEPVLTGLKRVSKPGLRVYAGAGKIPRVYGGLGVAILSTPHGLLTGEQAWRRRLGGEILCYVW